MGGDGKPPLRDMLRPLVGKFISKPLYLIVGGVVGIALVGGGGVTLYLASNHNKEPQTTTKQQPVAGTDEQTAPSAKGQNNQETTPTGNSQSPSSSSTTPKSSSAKTGGSGSTGNKSSGGGTGTSGSGGTSGGGGTTPRGPIALKIMPLGDSITQGGVGDPATVNSYRLELWNNLGSAYAIDYVGSWQNGNSQLADKDLNGFSGDCIKTNPCHGDQDLYSRTANWITTEDPDLVIMQGGGNDFVDPTMTETKVETYMEDWISLVLATKPSVKIIVTGATQYYPNYSAALQTYVSGLQNSGKPIRYVTYDNVDTVDGTHPSLAGYVTWGDALATKVRELFP